MATLERRNDDTKCSDLNWIFASSHILAILNYEKFEQFLAENRIKSDDDLFEGFLFFVKTVSRSLLGDISRSWSLNLQEDFTFSRAVNRGIPLSKIKNSCLKTIFVKNLHRLLQDWWSSCNKKELSRRYKTMSRAFLAPIEKIQRNNVNLMEGFEKYEKDEIIRRLAIVYALISLNDTDRGYPKGYFFSLSKSNLTMKYLSKIFTGYKFTLVFVWKELLKKYKKDKITLLSKLEKSKNWLELDPYFKPIQNQITDPLETEFHLSLGFGKFFQIKKPISTKIFNEIFYKKLPEPTLSNEEDLQQTLFWYPVQAMSGMYIFNGVATFASLLSGTVTLKRLYGNEEKSYVIRFIHPEASGNNYSYAVLIEAFGTIADYSGWLIFFDCCTDYSGFGGSEHEFAEMIIKRYKSIGAIEVTDYKVDSEALLNYLKIFSAELTDTYHPFIDKIPTDGDVKKHKKVLEPFSLPSRVNRLNIELESCKGLLLELLAYYFFVSGKCTLKWRYKNPTITGQGEIDIIAKDRSGTLNLVSCMSSFNVEKIKTLINESRKAASSKALLKKDFGMFKNMRAVIFLPRDLNPQQRRIAKSFNVTFYSLQDLFRENTCFSNVKKSDFERIFGLKEIKANRLGIQGLFF